MGIMAILRGDRGRVRFGMVSKTRGNARKFGHKARPARMMRQPSSHRPAIVSAYCNNRVVAQDEDRMEIAPVFRGDRFRVLFWKSFKNAGNSSRNVSSRKKSRMGPFPGGNVRQNASSRRSMRAKTCSIWGQNSGKRTEVGRSRPLTQSE
jgi:hypothetical protein